MQMQCSKRLMVSAAHHLNIWDEAVREDTETPETDKVCMYCDSSVQPFLANPVNRKLLRQYLPEMWSDIEVQRPII